MKDELFNIAGQHVLEQAKRKHAKAAKRIDGWTKAVKCSRATRFDELKKTANSVDYVKPHTVFDLGGNDYRIVTLIDYTVKVILVKYFFTHAEYDKWNRAGRP